MSTPERPAKRQRNSLSASPAPASPASPAPSPRPSPPLSHSGDNPRHDSRKHGDKPFPSPSRMSSTSYHASPPDQSSTFPTPPSTAGFSSHPPPLPSHSLASDMTTHPATPAHDSPASLQRDFNSHPHDTVMETGDIPMADAPPADSSGRQQQPALVSSASAAPYAMPLLCQTHHPISQPHPSQNLLSLYGLDAIASTVARRDPVTGEKINKLRKSYEGKVKNLGLPGRNKPTDRPGELLGFMEWPDEGWYDQKVHSKELDRADSAPFMSKLGRALQMNPGRLPAEEHDKWRNLLAMDDPAVKTPSLPPTKNAAQQAMLKTQAPSMRASAPASPRATSAFRPDRINKKRRYDESSYEGYQDDDGYSTGGLDDKRNSAAKKRRKDFSPNFDGSGSNFGNNSMVGLGVRSS